jgi:hypothetical protein
MKALASGCVPNFPAPPDMRAEKKGMGAELALVQAEIY